LRADVRYREEWTALNELVATTPTTLQGCAAAFRYIEAYTKACQQGGLLFADFSEQGDLACNFLWRVASVHEPLSRAIMIGRKSERPGD